MNTDIQPGEAFRALDTDLGRMIAAQLALRLQEIDMIDILNPAADFTIDASDTEHVTLRATIVREITWGDYLGIAYPYRLTSSPRRVAACPVGVREEYRRQFETEPYNPNRVPVHPDQVDLWAQGAPAHPSPEPVAEIIGIPRPYSEAVDHEFAGWNVDDVEEHALDMLAVVAQRRAEGRP